MEKAQISKALLEVQKELSGEKLRKDASNPFHKAKYVTLHQLMELVVPVLNKHGVLLLQQVTALEGQPALNTRLIHTDGSEIFDTMLLLHAKADPQGQGSAITYARRYSLMSMLGLVGDEDDDGNAATKLQTTPSVTIAKPGQLTSTTQAPAGPSGFTATATAEVITDAQLRYLHASLRRKGFEDAQDRATILHTLTDRPTLKDLPRQQASSLIADIDAMTKQELEGYLNVE